jgi:hypothetical protein
MSTLIRLFQSEIRKLLERYPQLNETISVELRQFISTEVIQEVTSGDALSWIK